MFNPFTEVIDESADFDLIIPAKNGNRDALEKLVLRHQAWIYNIALRMVFHPQDAEEVTQEVLIKAITRLSTFQGDSRFRTWLYRITANHVLNMKRRGGEMQTLTFSGNADAINETPDFDLPDPKSVPVDRRFVAEEAKISCTTGMLLCLDRKQRLVFTLGEIFGASDIIGSEILEMSPDNFRQSLACPPRSLPVHERPMRIGEREQSPPLPSRKLRASSTLVTSIRINQEVRFPAYPANPGGGSRCCSSKSMMSCIGNARPSIGNIHFFSHPNRCNGSVRFWNSQTFARPCISIEEIRFAAVTVALPPCLRGRRTNPSRNFATKRLS